MKLSAIPASFIQMRGESSRNHEREPYSPRPLGCYWGVGGRHREGEMACIVQGIGRGGVELSATVLNLPYP
jgi:hypothetical protein